MNDSKKQGLLLFGISLSTILGVIFGESWIIAVVAILGPIFGFLTLFIISYAISVVILIAYDKYELSNILFIQRIGQWAKNKGKNINPVSLRLLRVSKILAFLFSTVTAGPFVTIIFSRLFARPKTNFYIVALVSSLIFSFVWTLIYSGAIILIKQVIDQLV